jgi:hypothetical protein
MLGSRGFYLVSSCLLPRPVALLAMARAQSTPSISPTLLSLLLLIVSMSSQWHDNFNSLVLVSNPCFICNNPKNPRAKNLKTFSKTFLLTSEVIQFTHQQGLGRSGRYGPKNAARISRLHGEERKCLQANHQRITNVLT